MKVWKMILGVVFGVLILVLAIVLVSKWNSQVTWQEAVDAGIAQTQAQAEMDRARAVEAEARAREAVARAREKEALAAELHAQVERTRAFWHGLTTLFPVLTVNLIAILSMSAIIVMCFYLLRYSLSKEDTDPGEIDL